LHGKTGLGCSGGQLGRGIVNRAVQIGRRETQLLGVLDQSFVLDGHLSFPY
jgi:hypothetical protein